MRNNTPTPDNRDETLSASKHLAAGESLSAVVRTGEPDKVCYFGGAALSRSAAGSCGCCWWMDAAGVFGGVLLG